MYVSGGAAISLSSSACEGTGGMLDFSSGSLSPGWGGSMYDSGRGLRNSFGASSVISTSALLVSVLIPLAGGAGDATSDPGLGVETSRSGVEAAAVPRLFFLYGPRFPGARTGATGVEVEAGEALDTGVGGGAAG
jgi:hypothetical protein